MKAFVEAAKANNVKALASVGGWDGCAYWSSNVGSAENRTAFVKTVSDLVTTYSLDGLDFECTLPFPSFLRLFLTISAFTAGSSP